MEEVTVCPVLGKVMFLHLSVILFTGGCLPDTPLGRHPPGRHPQPPKQILLFRHPPGRHSLGQISPHVYDSPRRSPETTTAADRTHPTGMHSCL